jgi:hypothetical protein
LFLRTCRAGVRNEIVASPRKDRPASAVCMLS